MGEALDYRISRIGPRHIDQFNNLYNRVFQRERTIDRYLWEFKNGPYGEAYQLVALDPHENVLAHWGLLPNFLRTAGECLQSGKLENTCIDPDLKGKGLYKELEERCLEMAWSEGYHAVWTTYSAASWLHVKTGFRPLDEMVELQRPASFSLPCIVRNFTGLLRTCPINLKSYRSLLGSFRSALRKAMKSGKTSGRHNRPQTSIFLPFTEDCVTGLLRKWAWECGNQPGNLYTWTLNRSYAYLKWRFMDNPYVKYHCYTVHNGDNAVCGYIVWHRLFTTVVLDDLLLLADSFRSQTVDDILFNLHNQGLFGPSFTLNFMTFRQSGVYDVMIDAGFVPSAGATDDLGKFLLVCLNPGMESERVESLMQSRHWYVNRLFMEGLA